MTFLQATVRGILPASLFLLAACQTVDSEAVQKRSAQLDLNASASELQVEVERAIATPHAQDVASCKVVAFGAKACGGPSSYLVYSTEVTEEAPLLELIARYNMLESEQNKREGMVSTCDMVLPPVVILHNGVCTASSEAIADY